MSSAADTIDRTAEIVCARIVQRFASELDGLLVSIFKQLRENALGDPRSESDLETDALPSLLRAQLNSLSEQSSVASACSKICEFANVDGDLDLVCKGCFTEISKLTLEAWETLRVPLAKYPVSKIRNQPSLDGRVRNDSPQPHLLIAPAESAARSVHQGIELVRKLEAYARAFRSRKENCSPELVDRYRDLRNHPPGVDCPFNPNDKVKIEQVAEYLNVTESYVRLRLNDHNRAASPQDKVLPIEGARGNKAGRYLWKTFHDFLRKIGLHPKPKKASRSPNPHKPR